jgi:hypothetical protein
MRIKSLLILIATAMLLIGLALPTSPARAQGGGQGTLLGSHPAVNSSVSPNTYPNSYLTMHAGSVVNGSYAAAGCAMRNLGYCNIQISGVPGGSRVVSAYLVWSMLLGNVSPSGYGTGTFAGTPISGAIIGQGPDLCWGNSYSLTFWKNVTSLVYPGGNGTYALNNFPSGTTNGQDPFLYGSTAPMMEGATLVIVYSNRSMPREKVLLYLGDYTNLNPPSSTISQTFGGFVANGQAPSTTTSIISDGQNNANSDDTALFNGVPFGNFLGFDPLVIGGPYSAGNLHDTVSADVSPEVNSGDTSFTVTLEPNGDCVAWNGQVFATGTSASS